MNKKDILIRKVNYRIKSLLLNPILTRFHPGNFLTFFHKNRTFAIKFHNYDEWTKNLEDRLNEQRNDFTPPKFITHVLEAVGGCKYVIFQGVKENHFVQFWVGDNKLEMDFPISYANFLLMYLKDARKLLEVLGFSFTDKELEYMKYTYLVDNAEDLHCLKANFGKNNALATEFVIKVFQDLYKEDLLLLTVKLG